MSTGRFRLRYVAGALIGIAVATGTIAFVRRGSPRHATHGKGAADPPLAFVGRSKCVSCHAAEAAAYASSHHDLAMQEAKGAAVLGNFDDAHFVYAGITSTFFRRDGKPYVRTDGPDGALHDYPIRFTFGVAPLQQYLIDLEGGRLQALGIAWDTRPKERGGQRWFHLYPDQHIAAGDPLHWTGRMQNWNSMCAECHSTDLHSGFDANTGRYATTYAEIDVSCEACHGPGSRHVAWTRHETGSEDATLKYKGFPVGLDERRGVTWSIDGETGNARRSRPRTTSREIDACARCHSRRAPIGDHYEYGKPIGQTHRVALLEEPLYYADGQIEGEVYEYGSFLESRMNHAGVSCSDCHNPHSLQLVATGSSVCMQCHSAERYRTAAHHHHAEASAGADCIACHMPARTYMVVDPRRDHSIRIPRPDLTVTLKTPNACNGCHTDKTAIWARDRAREWFGAEPRGYQRFAEVFHAGTEQSAGAGQDLLRLGMDTTEPGIARASAISRVDRIPNPNALEALRLLLRDADPLVRRAAVGVYSGAPPTALSDLIVALEDPVRDVRLEAARAIARLPAARLGEIDKQKRARAIDEYIAVAGRSSDWPEARLGLGALYEELGEKAKAKGEFEAALRLDPAFAPALVNLVDLDRREGHDAEGEALARNFLARRPDEAIAHHALGLVLAREGRHDEAISALARAAELAPDDAELGYVYAIALGSAGKREDSLQVLEQNLSHHPNHRESLLAVISLERDAGRATEARRQAQRLLELEPDDPLVRSLVKELSGGGRSVDPMHAP